MRIVIATLLAIMLVASEAHAYSKFADLLFGKQPDWDRQVDDEAFGDEFKIR